jgi:hypothetical protein
MTMSDPDLQRRIMLKQVVQTAIANYPERINIYGFSPMCLTKAAEGLGFKATIQSMTPSIICMNPDFVISVAVDGKMVEIEQDTQGAKALTDCPEMA